MGPRSRSPKTARIVVAVLALIAIAAPARTPAAAAPSDLDAFMRQVLAKRDDNWKKLQQYILDEREKIELRGPGHLPIWGDLREYTSTKLYPHDQSRRQARSHDQDDPEDKEMQRLLNKVALVTIWVEPSAHQIVKYTFDNVGFDFLPAQWLVRINDLRATMTMSQPFPDVWLPHGLEMTAAITLAVGGFDLNYALDYHDYRQPDVKAKGRIKGGGGSRSPAIPPRRRASCARTGCT